MDPHDNLRELLNQGINDDRIDAALNECPDMECMECSRIICPHGEPLHFHHDGCPSCAEDE